MDRLLLLAAHAQLGAIGFGTLTAIGVGSRMLPTFLHAPGDDQRRLHLQLGLTSAGLLLFLVGAIAGAPRVIRAGSVLLIVAGGFAVALGARWFGRRQRTLDASLWHVASAWRGSSASARGC